MSVRVEALEPRQLLAAAVHSATPPDVVPSTDRLVFSQVQGTEGRPQQVKLKNRGKTPLTIQSVSLAGDDAGAFALTARRTSMTLRRGASVKFKVAFKPTGAAVFGAALQVNSNDQDTPLLAVALRGLGTAGRFEASEPSLQRVLDTFQIPVNVGDGNPATSELDGPMTNDESAAPLLKKAGPGRVRVSLLAVYSWEWKPAVARIGWYAADRSQRLRKALTVRPGSAQQLVPKASGKTTFDPGTGSFGLYSTWPSEQHGPVFSQDGLNTWDRTWDRGHKVRFFPLKTPAGEPVANAYVVAMEQAFNSDFQDAVLIIENVTPAT